MTGLRRPPGQDFLTLAFAFMTLLASIKSLPSTMSRKDSERPRGQGWHRSGWRCCNWHNYHPEVGSPHLPPPLSLWVVCSAPPGFLVLVLLSGRDKNPTHPYWLPIIKARARLKTETMPASYKHLTIISEHNDQFPINNNRKKTADQKLVDMIWAFALPQLTAANSFLWEN